MIIKIDTFNESSLSNFRNIGGHLPSYHVYQISPPPRLFKGRKLKGPLSFKPPSPLLFILLLHSSYCLENIKNDYKNWHF